MPRKTGRRPRRPAGAGRFNEAAARCRGKHVYPDSLGHRTIGFNEAAARCRGKRELETVRGERRGLASMRPRPDAAENPCFYARARSGSRSASMRPRPDAAENSGS